MRWSNPTKPIITSSYEFSRNQFPSNSKQGQFLDTDIATQKNLIYDLRSELSNIKNQFSKLVTKPADRQPKQWKDVHETAPNHMTSTTFHSTFAHSDKQKPHSYLENISNTQKRYPQKDVNQISKSYTVRSSSFANDKNIGQPNLVINGNNELISQNQLHKIGKYRPQIQTATSQDKHNQSLRSTKHEEYLNREREKEYLKVRLQPNNYTQTTIDTEKLSYLSSQIKVDPKISELQLKLKQKTRQNQEFKRKIALLSSQAEEITSSKNKEVASMRQLLSKAKQEMKEDLNRERKKHAEKLEEENKRNIQIINKLKEQKQRLQEQINGDRQKHLNQVKEETSKAKKQQNQAMEEQRKKFTEQIQQLQQKICQKNEFIQGLLSERQKQNKSLLQEKQNMLKNAPLKTNWGVNTQQPIIEGKVQAQQNQVSPKKQCQSNQKQDCLSEDLEKKEKQVQQLQERMKIYLNNIDKQSYKIKEYKSQVQISQNFIRESEFLINQKENAFQHVLSQLKNAQKQIQEQRNSNKALQNLLQVSNENLIQSKMNLLNRKFMEMGSE